MGPAVAATRLVHRKPPLFTQHHLLFAAWIFYVLDSSLQHLMHHAKNFRCTFLGFVDLIK